MLLEVYIFKKKTKLEALLVEVSGTKNSNSDGQKATKNVSLFFGIKATGTLITAYFSGYSLKYLTK